MADIEGTNDEGKPVVKRKFGDDGSFQIVFKSAGADCHLGQLLAVGNLPAR